MLKAHAQSGTLVGRLPWTDSPRTAPFLQDLTAISDLLQQSVAVQYLAYQAGNLRAFELLWEHVVPQLRRYVASRFQQQLGSSACEDIVQESMLQLHRNRDTFVLGIDLFTLQYSDEAVQKADNTLYKWLLQVCRNRALDLIRKQGTERRGLQQVLHQANTTPVQGEPDDRLEVLARLVDQLPENQRHIVQQHTFADRSMAEIAASLGLREGTVRTRASRAYSALRAMFAHQTKEL